MEGLGVSFMRSAMTLFAFLPILWDAVRKDLRIALDRPGQPLAGLGGDSLRTGGNGADGRCRRQAAGAELKISVSRRRSARSSSTVRTMGNEPPRRGSVHCSPTCGEITSDCSFITCISTWPDTRICSSASSFPISPSDLPWLRASSLLVSSADRSGLRQGGKLVPISCEQLDHDRRTDLRIQTAPCLRTPHPRRRGECVPSGIVSELISALGSMRNTTEAATQAARVPMAAIER